MTATVAATLTVTVMDTATIYEGPESVYRYDLPGTGIVDGWALGGAIEQAKKLMGGHWPHVDITVIVDPTGSAVSKEAAEILRRQFTLSDATVTTPQAQAATDPDTAVFKAVGGKSSMVPAARVNQGGTDANGDTVDQHPAPSDREPHLPAPVRRRRPKGGKHHKKRKPLYSFEPLNYLDPFHGVIAAVVFIVIGVCWWTLRGGEPTEGAEGTGVEAPLTAAAEKHDAEPPAQSELPTESNAGDAPLDLPTLPAEPNGEIPAHEEEVGPVTVKLPDGFNATEKEGVYTATGKDPDLRILIAADPMYSVPQDALFTQLKEDVAADDALDKAFERDGRFLYTETPGDGSSVDWTTWVDTDHQISIGCHSRKEPTTVQKAACRMAVESAKFTAGSP